MWEEEEENSGEAATIQERDLLTFSSTTTFIEQKQQQTLQTVNRDEKFAVQWTSATDHLAMAKKKVWFCVGGTRVA